jgi:hypothetical protein
MYHFFAKASGNGLRRRMFKIMAVACGLFLFSPTALAQRFNAFAGYSYSSGLGPNLSASLPLGPGSPEISHRLNGWNGSLEAKLLPVLGIVADFSGHYGNATTDIICFIGPEPGSCEAQNANLSLYTFTLGPQVSLRLGRIEPYAHALFGGALYRTLTFPGSHTSFADVLGGGIDVAVIPWLAWRVQADALQTRLSLPLIPNKQNGLRLSTGVVFRF